MWVSLYIMSNILKNTRSVLFFFFACDLFQSAIFVCLCERGRFGVVRECRENATGKVYMAKIVPYGPDSKQDALREYEVLKSLHSDRVMALHEAYVTPRYLVLVAEYCSGKELLYSLIDR